MKSFRAIRARIAGWRGWWRYAPVAVVLGIGLTLSTGAFTKVRTLEDANARADFERRASLMAAALKESIHVGLDDVQSTSDFRATAGKVSEGEVEALLKSTADWIDNHLDAALA